MPAEHARSCSMHNLPWYLPHAARFRADTGLYNEQAQDSASSNRQGHSMPRSPTLLTARATGLRWSTPCVAACAPPPRVPRGGAAAPGRSALSARRPLRAPACGRWCAKCASRMRVSAGRDHLHTSQKGCKLGCGSGGCDIVTRDYSWRPPLLAPYVWTLRKLASAAARRLWPPQLQQGAPAHCHK